MWQLWYLWSLIPLYCLLIPISRTNNNNLKIILGLLIFVGFVLQYLSYITGTSIQGKVIQTFRLWTHMKYFLIGYVCKNHLESFSRHFTGRTLSIIYTVITSLYLVFILWIGKYVMPIGSSEYFYDDLFFMLWSVCTLIAFIKITLSRKIEIFTKRFIPLILGVYVVHPLTMRVVQNYIGIDTTVRGICFWIYGIVSAFFAVDIIIRVPLIRNCVFLGWFKGKNTNGK